VSDRANKKQIQEAIERIFKVKVDHVRTMNVPGKMRRRAHTRGHSRTLAQGRRSGSSQAASFGSSVLSAVVLQVCSPVRGGGLAPAWKAC